MKLNMTQVDGNYVSLDATCPKCSSGKLHQYAKSGCIKCNCCNAIILCGFCGASHHSLFFSVCENDSSLFSINCATCGTTDVYPKKPAILNLSMSHDCEYCGGECDQCQHCKSKQDKDRALIVDISEEDKKLFSQCPSCKANDISPCEYGLSCRKCGAKWTPLSFSDTDIFKDDVSTNSLNHLINKVNSCIGCNANRGIVEYPNGILECFLCKCIWSPKITDKKGNAVRLNKRANDAKDSLTSSVCKKCKSGFINNGKCEYCQAKVKEKAKAKMDDVKVVCRICKNEHDNLDSIVCKECEEIIDQVNEERKTSLAYICDCEDNRHLLQDDSIFTTCALCDGISTTQEFRKFLNNVNSPKIKQFETFCEEMSNLEYYIDFLKEMFGSLHLSIVNGKKNHHDQFITIDATLEDLINTMRLITQGAAHQDEEQGKDVDFDVNQFERDFRHENIDDSIIGLDSDEYEEYAYAQRRWLVDRVKFYPDDTYFEVAIEDQQSDFDNCKLWEYENSFIIAQKEKEEEDFIRYD